MAYNMYNLAKIIEQSHKDREREKERQRGEEERQREEERERERQMNQVQSSEPLTVRNDGTVEILQPAQQNNINSESASLRQTLRNVAQSYESTEEDVSEDNKPANEGKFNCAATVMFVLLYGMPIFLVVFGSIHLKDCPAQKMVPISFIIWGSLALVSRILSVPEECRQIFNKKTELKVNAVTICRVGFNFIVQLATSGIFIALNVWIFTLHPDTEEGSANYCNKELYLTAYWLSVVIWSIPAIAILCVCCIGCLTGCAIVCKGE